MYLHRYTHTFTLFYHLCDDLYIIAKMNIFP